MKKLDLSLSQFAFVVGTRAILAVGIGLLAAEKLPRKARRSVGFTLATLGLLTTIPAAISVFGARIPGKLGEALRAA